MENHLSLHRADELKAPVATLCAMFDYAVAAAPERVALRHLGAALTYRELGRAVTALAQRPRRDGRAGRGGGTGPAQLD